MNLRDCIRTARDQLLHEAVETGALVTTEQIVARALDLNGARSEFEEQAQRRALRTLRADAKRALQEATEEPLEEDSGQGHLFALLPGPPAPRAIALPGEPGEYAYKPFEATTDDDLAANDQVLAENIARAEHKRVQAQDRRRFLSLFRSSPETTTIEALEAAAASRDGSPLAGSTT